MAEGNGASVTWRELNLLRETINERFDNLEESVESIKSTLTTRTAFWANAWTLVVSAAIGAAVGTGIWFIFG